jgi:hypothetical protein
MIAFVAPHTRPTAIILSILPYEVQTSNNTTKLKNRKWKNNQNSRIENRRKSKNGNIINNVTHKVMR